MRSFYTPEKHWIIYSFDNIDEFIDVCKKHHLSNLLGFGYNRPSINTYVAAIAGYPERSKLAESKPFNLYSLNTIKWDTRLKPAKLDDQDEKEAAIKQIYSDDARVFVSDSIYTSPNSREKLMRDDSPYATWVNPHKLDSHDVFWVAATADDIMGDPVGFFITKCSDGSIHLSQECLECGWLVNKNYNSLKSLDAVLKHAYSNFLIPVPNFWEAMNDLKPFLVSII